MLLPSFKLSALRPSINLVGDDAGFSQLANLNNLSVQILLPSVFFHHVEAIYKVIERLLSYATAEILTPVDQNQAGEALFPVLHTCKSHLQCVCHQLNLLI